MSAIATKKPFGDQGVQLTFPLNFQKTYALTPSYFPSFDGAPMDIMIGRDFQSDYHEQKRLEANQSVMNGVQNKKTAEIKLLTGHQNYHLPKPVLGQRIYANPALGAESYSSTRRDNGADAPFRTVEVGKESVGLEGGVMRTIEGQDFYKKQLERRIAQLNRINALAQGFAVEMGQKFYTQDNEKEGSADKVAFFSLLREVMDSILDGRVSRFTIDNLRGMGLLMFKIAPTFGMDDFEDVIDASTSIIETLNGVVLNALVKDEEKRYSMTAQAIFERFLLFAREMVKNINLSERDKKTLVNSLKKALGFTQLLRKESDTAGYFTTIARDKAINQNVGEDLDGDLGGDAEPVQRGAGRRGRGRVSGVRDGRGDGEFDQPAETREDAEARGMPRAPLAGNNDDPNRERFGFKSGRFIHGEAEFFGETKEDANPPIVFPLGVSDVDPNAEASVPVADTTTFREAVEDQIKIVLEPLGWREGIDVDTFVSNNYPRVDDFVAEVGSGLEEKGYTKAQIANGMIQTRENVFAEYIAEHTGDVGNVPQQVTSARMREQYGELPIYRDANDDGIADAVLTTGSGRKRGRPRKSKK